MSEKRPRVPTLYRAAVVLMVAGLIVDTAIWALACRRIERGAHEAAAAAGWTLSAGAVSWSGWPIAAEITLPDAVLRAGPEIIPPLVWAAPRPVLRLSIWHPTVLTASAYGPQTIAIGSGAPIPFTAQTLIATIDLTNHDPVRVTAATLDVTSPGGPVGVRSANLLLRPDGVSIDLSGISLPGSAGRPITPAIDTLALDGRITPPIEPQPTASESARRWRAQGGKLELSAVSLRWGSLDATGQATLTLDQALQPDITGRVTASGLASVIEQLAQTGTMTRSAATAAQGMLAILSAPSGGGPVSLPVALRDGIVSLARIPLLRLAPLAWDPAQ